MSLFAEYRPETRRGRPVAGLVLRAATKGDLDAIAALQAGRGQVDAAEARAGFARMLERAHAGNALLLVACAGGAVAAYGAVTRFSRPPDPPGNCAPEGWYLGGVVVDPALRRRGVARALTRARLEWIAARADVAWYFANARNRATHDLHAPFGFLEVTRDFRFPGVTFTGGTGILYRADLAAR